MTSSSAIAARVRAGDVRAAARLMRDLDDRLPGAEATLRELLPHTGRAVVIGLTGPPGGGKSSLVDRLIAHHRRAGQTVGVLAVDPTSPFTGGAILGDRIRMQDHALDEGVFIRSLATRGHLGGLSRSAAALVAVMDAMGRNVILVETVGVGQDEIEVASLVRTVVVVAVPGLGDDVQAIKAGVLEIADVFAVNKADREGSDRVVRDLQLMLELRRAVGSGAVTARPSQREWTPPIVQTVAVKDQGTAELAGAIERHGAHLAASGEGRLREVQRARAGFVAILRERMLAGAIARLEEELGRLDAVAARIAAREVDPYQLADELAARLRG
jgi:LAO/AO transport system kinase